VPIPAEESQVSRNERAWRLLAATGTLSTGLFVSIAPTAAAADDIPEFSERADQR
jgi:hypothetical protein